MQGGLFFINLASYLASTLNIIKFNQNEQKIFTPAAHPLRVEIHKHTYTSTS